MDFNFSDDEELWTRAVRDFAKRELASKNMIQCDQSLRETIKKIGELGYFSLRLPEQYGGTPESSVMLGLLVEEIAKVNVGLAYLILVSHEVSRSLAVYGGEEAKDEWLPLLIAGEKTGCICATEPDAGVDFESIETKAVIDEDRYLVSGVKTPVSFGMDADVGLCFVKTNEAGEKGKTAMLVPLHLAGVNRSPVRHMGLDLTHPASLKFDETAVPLKFRVGGEGSGFLVNVAEGTLSSINKIMSALISLGMAQTAVNLAILYAKERPVFGQPLAKFEEISFKLAEDATLIEAGKWLCYRALYLQDHNLPNLKEAAMCGWWCPKISYQVLQDSLLIHGHGGYSDEYPVQQMLRDVVAFEMISGTEQMLKLIIGHEVVGPLGVPDPLVSYVGNHEIQNV